MFNIGDKIVYPMHGAGVIEDIEEKEILGEKKSYYVMKIPVGNLKVLVPVDNVEDIGIRDIISPEEADSVIKIFSVDKETKQINWNKRYRDNLERIKTGDIFEVARVVRNLMKRDSLKGLSTGERKMLTNAKHILISELVLVKNLDKDELEEKIDKIFEDNMEEE